METFAVHIHCLCCKMNPATNDELENDNQHIVLEEWSAERLARASYKDLGSVAEVERRFFRLLLSTPSCKSSLKVLLTSKSATCRDYSLEIDAFDLLDSDPILGHLLLRFPSTLLDLLEKSIVEAQQEILRELTVEAEKEGTVVNAVVKGQNGSRVHARLVHLPPNCSKMSLGSLQASDVGKIVQCRGTVVRTSTVCMYEVRCLVVWILSPFLIGNCC